MVDKLGIIQHQHNCMYAEYTLMIRLLQLMPFYSCYAKACLNEQIDTLDAPPGGNLFKALVITVKLGSTEVCYYYKTL